MKARYAICTIVTSDKALVERVNKLRKKTGAKHSDIYEAGLKAFEVIVKESEVR